MHISVFSVRSACTLHFVTCGDVSYLEVNFCRQSCIMHASGQPNFPFNLSGNVNHDTNKL